MEVERGRGGGEERMFVECYAMLELKIKEGRGGREEGNRALSVNSSVRISSMDY